MTWYIINKDPEPVRAHIEIQGEATTVVKLETELQMAASASASLLPRGPIPLTARPARPPGI